MGLDEKRSWLGRDCNCYSHNQHNRNIGSLIMKTILALQAYLQASETSIDVVLALFFGLIALMITGYLIEQRISKDEQDVQKQFDWE